MCGIVALLAQRGTDVRLSLVRGIQQLRNRGYDSCGALLVTDDQKAWVFKSAAVRSMEELEQAIQGQTSASVGLCHTRWSTHGAKSPENAHPHCDMAQRFHVVHNGIITNYTELRKRLIDKKYVFRSETDTEVIPMLLADCLQSLPDLELFHAWQMVIKSLDGTWALAMVDCQNPHVLYVARRGSPLLLAVSEDGNMLGLTSERAGFAFPVTRLTEVGNDAILQCYWDGDWVVDPRVSGHDWLVSEPERLPTTPAPYEYWTEKEVHEQPDSIWAALNGGGRLYQDHADIWRVKLGGLRDKIDKLRGIQHLLLVGCGTSLHAGLLALPLFKRLEFFTTVQAIDASEFNVYDLPNSGTVGVVFLSQSGETRDCQRVLELLPQKVITLGVVNVPDSQLARNTTCGTYLNAGREVGVAATKSFTSQAVVLSLIAMWFDQYVGRGECIQEWAPAVHQLSLVFRQEVPKLQEFVVQVLMRYPTLSMTPSLFLIGAGFGLPIMYEAALKIKEISYIHAEAFGGATMKHGSFALLSDGPQSSFVLALVLEGPDRDKMLSALEQVYARGARLVVIGNSSMIARWESICPTYMIPVHQEFSASLVSVLFFQLLAIELAKRNFIDMDYPRNLAKTVSV